SIGVWNHPDKRTDLSRAWRYGRPRLRSRRRVLQNADPSRTRVNGDCRELLFTEMLLCGRWAQDAEGLLQAGAAEAFQIVLAVALALDRHLLRDPGARHVWLRAAKLLQGDPGDIGLAGHARCGGEHAVAAGEIAAQADGGARQPHRLVIFAPDELGVGPDAVIKRREGIPRAQPQRTAGRPDRFLPATHNE